MKYLLLVYICLRLKWTWAISSMGPVGHIVGDAIYKCEEKPDLDILNMEIKLGKDDNDIWMEGIIDLKEKLDDTFKFELDLENYAQGKWEKFYNLKGKLCTDANKIIPKLWYKLIQSAEPSPLQCPFEPGTYKFTKFIAKTEDLELPSIFYGPFRLKAVLRDQNGKMVTCFTGEGDSLPP